MDAAILTDSGSPVFGTYDEPSAGPGQVVVDVAVAGLNPVDLTMAAGRFPGFTPQFPSVPGREGIGTVDGRRVYFTTTQPFGSMALRALAEETELFEVQRIDGPPCRSGSSRWPRRWPGRPPRRTAGSWRAVLADPVQVAAVERVSGMRRRRRPGVRTRTHDRVDESWAARHVARRGTAAPAVSGAHRALDPRPKG